MNEAISKLASAKSATETLRVSLVELLNECPVDQGNPHQCPLCHVRQLPFLQRLHWLKLLNHDDLEYLAAYHHVCQNIKLKTKTY